MNQNWCSIQGLLIGSLFVIIGTFLIEIGLYGMYIKPITGILMIGMGICGSVLGGIGILNNLWINSPFISEISRKEIMEEKE